MSTSPNPEFEYYRRRLLQRRRYYPIYGLLLLITGGLGCLAQLLDYFSTPTLLFTFTQPSALLHLFLLLVFLALIALGIELIRRSFTSPVPQTVQQFRQRQRRRLFKQAQGQGPWWSNIFIRLGIIIVGLIFTAGACLVFWLFGVNALDGWLYLLVGIFLLALTFYFSPRELKKFPALSAQQLARELISGETTPSSEGESELF